MKIFTCQACGQLVYFENLHCERCKRNLGYLPDQGILSAVEPAKTQWTALANPNRRYRFCANWEAGVCNWLVDVASGDRFCAACAHNGIVPNASEPHNLVRWQRIEEAKRRLFYTLLKLRLPTPTAASNPGQVGKRRGSWDRLSSLNASVMVGYSTSTSAGKEMPSPAFRSPGRITRVTRPVFQAPCSNTLIQSRP